MTDKQIIIDICPYQGECSVSGCKRNDDGCFVRQLFEERNRAENRIVELNKSIQAKEQEYEKLRQYHNKCCEEFEKEKKEWLEKYNQVSRDFYSGKYCNAEKCQQLDQLKAENEQLKNNDVFSIRYFKDKYDVLKQTLVEIKEIANRSCCTQPTTTCEEYENCNECGRISDADAVQQILQKISEVEDES